MIAEDPAVIAELTTLLWYTDYDHRNLDDVIRQYRGFTPNHQVGGYSDAVQHQVEISAAYHVRGPAPGSVTGYEDPSFLAEARRWTTLLQLDEDTDARMVWGDGAIAVWAIRPTDLATRTFTNIFFTTDGH